MSCTQGGPLTAERLNDIRERAEAASPQAGAAGIYDPALDVVEIFREHLSFGSGPVWIVWLPEHPLTAGEHPRPDHAVVSAVTGNGPTSEANARFFASARADITDLLTAYAAVVAERDALAATLEQKRRRSIICGWCARTWKYVEGVDDVDALAKEAIRHDRECEKNPLVADLAALRATVAPLADSAHRFIEAVEGNPGANETMDSLIALKRAIFEVRALLARASIPEGT